ncbi:hypothetical protein IQ235_08225 [Oscillatoriales cyanobacterium LEGE 11467]|uniref:Uncharacterized protein n=1 Tax=Zarconia navalis LEGE 11467 TaxID=1828826 RepID=A0A928Z8K6_9CYAN|nr:hypothetical protein [Zarconia navalis]MBE9040763.1 hypothetical protein [Zarconia navalis LEGE 11467]
MTEPKLSHSKMGIASFCVGLFVLWLITNLNLRSFGIDDYIFFLLFALIGLGLAIAGMFYKNRNRLFPTLGCVMNTACLIAILALRSEIVWN